MTEPQHRPADDIGKLLAGLKPDEGFRYLDLQRSEHASRALLRWPLLRRLEADLRSRATGPAAGAA